MHSVYSKKLMEEVICQHLHDWEVAEPAQACLGLHKLPKRMVNSTRDIFPHARNIQTSVEYKDADGIKYHVGDMAWLGTAYGHASCILWYHFDVDGIVFTVAEV